jgi:hypothetical protein
MITAMLFIWNVILAHYLFSVFGKLSNLLGRYAFKLFIAPYKITTVSKSYFLRDEGYIVVGEV